MDDATQLKRPKHSSVRMSLSAVNVSAVKRSWLPPLVYLSYNPVTLAGLFLMNAAVVSWLFVLKHNSGSCTHR
jgi:hypothetical protein